MVDSLSKSVEKDLGQRIWDYMVLGQSLRKADIILGMGSTDLVPAERAAELYKFGLAPIILFSGKGGRNSELTPSGKNGMTEAEMLAEVAIENGVPSNDILLDKRATNSGENCKYSQELLAKAGINPEVIISVHMPYAERRDYATLRKQWAGPEFIMASPEVPFSEYHVRGFQGQMSRRDLVNDMLGDFQRLFIFPSKGFMVAQKDWELPSDKVIFAYRELIDIGYGEHQLVRENGKVVDIF
jgi:uncharacterized SAM-binding protein YcdF (DUF218 family)